MSKYSEYVTTMINDEDQMESNELELFSNQLFKMALEDEDAAYALFSASNSFSRAILKKIDREQMELFIKKYPELKEQVLVLYYFPYSSLKKKKEEPNKELTIFSLKKPEPNEFEFGRTQKAQNKNLFIEIIEEIPMIRRNEKKYPMITRHTRHFNQLLSSVGSSPTREIILFDPSSSLLQNIYETLKNSILKDASTLDILHSLVKTSRKQFISTKVKEFVRQQIKKNQCILLDEFIELGTGVCRHHTLLNTFLLDRLREDNILKGEVIHHRQDFKSGAHTWNLFRDKKSGELYSIDSLWNNVTSLADKPGALDRLYKFPVEELILHRFGPAKIDSESQEFLKKIKLYIETTDFPVSNNLFFQGSVIIIVNDKNKRVPRFVGEIYQVITNSNEMDSDSRLNEIQKITQKALKNIKSIKGQITIVFYQSLVNNQLPTIESNSSSSSIFKI